MKILPSILNHSYHRMYNGCWKEKAGEFIQRVGALKKKHGFDVLGINIGMGSAQDAIMYHTPQYIAEIKKQIDDAALVPIALLGALTTHADRNVMNASLQSILDTIEEAKLLGCKVSQFAMGTHGRVTREKNIRLARECMERISEKAVECDMDVCFENFYPYTGDEIKLIVGGLPKVGLLNDFGNWLCNGEDPVAATKKFTDITLHAHMKDYILEDGIWQSVPFGQGIVNLHEILNFIHDDPSDRTLYVAFENDLDFGDEDAALDICCAFFKDWQKSKAQ